MSKPYYGYDSSWLSKYKANKRAKELKKTKKDVIIRKQGNYYVVFCV